MDGAVGGPRPAGQPMRPAAGPMPQRPVAGSLQRPAGARPQQPMPRPAQPGMRPSQPVRRPMAQQPVGPDRQAQAAEYQQSGPAPAQRGKGGNLGIVIQFVVGLVVIIGVAAAVVWLWVKYYQ